MKTYFLSVLKPIPAGGHVVHVLRVEHSAGLHWMREHADEIATRQHGTGYDALMIRETLPADEVEAMTLRGTCEARGLALPAPTPLPGNSTTQAEAHRDAMHAELKHAETLAEMHALALDWMGLECVDADSTDDDPTTADEARGILADHIREFCYAAGVRCPDFEALPINTA